MQISMKKTHLLTAALVFSAAAVAEVMQPGVFASRLIGLGKAIFPWTYPLAKGLRDGFKKGTRS